MHTIEMFTTVVGIAGLVFLYMTRPHNRRHRNNPRTDGSWYYKLPPSQWKNKE